MALRYSKNQDSCTTASSDDGGNRFCAFGQVQCHGMLSSQILVLRLHSPQPCQVHPLQVWLVPHERAYFGASSLPHYDVVELDRVVCPVLLQQNPLKASSWWLDHFVAPYSL